jgi:hypothetical protein
MAQLRCIGPFHIHSFKQNKKITQNKKEELVIYSAT